MPWPRWHLNYFSEPGTSCLQVLFQVFPLHHTPSLENLQKSWVRKLFGLQPLGNKSLKPPSKSLCAGEISEYFGLKIAFYFAWLGHYTTALSIPAIVGGAFWVGVAISFKDTFILFTDCFQFFFHGRAEFLEDIGFVLFSLFNVTWATFYLEVFLQSNSYICCASICE